MKNKVITCNLLLFELIYFETFQNALVLKTGKEKTKDLITRFFKEKETSLGQARFDFKTALDLEFPDWPDWLLWFAEQIKSQNLAIVMVETAKLTEEIHPKTKKPVIRVNMDRTLLTPAPQSKLADSKSTDKPEITPEMAAENAAKAKHIMDTKGPPIWKDLHNYAATWDEDVESQQKFLEGVTQRIPCGECKGFWINHNKQIPPPTDTKESFFAWTVELHNKVNIKLSKPTMELAKLDVNFVV